MYAKIDKVNLNKKFKGDKSEYLLTTNYIFEDHAQHGVRVIAS